jgi:hypothetical protein
VGFVRLLGGLASVSHEYRGVWGEMAVEGLTGQENRAVAGGLGPGKVGRSVTRPFIYKGKGGRHKGQTNPPIQYGDSPRIPRGMERHWRSQGKGNPEGIGYYGWVAAMSDLIFDEYC